MFGMKRRKAEKAIIAQANETNADPTIVSAVTAALGPDAELLKDRSVCYGILDGWHHIKGVAPAFYGHLLAAAPSVTAKDMKVILDCGLVIPDVPINAQRLPINGRRPAQILARSLLLAGWTEFPEALNKLCLGDRIGLGIDKGTLRKVDVSTLVRAIESVGEKPPNRSVVLRA